MTRAKVTVTALVASAWFTDCDPFMSMAFNPKTWSKSAASTKFLHILRDDVKDQWEAQDVGEGDTEEQFQDDAKWSGLHLMDVEIEEEQMFEFGLNEDGSPIEPKHCTIGTIPDGFVYLEVR